MFTSHIFQFNENLPDYFTKTLEIIEIIETNALCRQSNFHSHYLFLCENSKLSHHKVQYCTSSNRSIALQMINRILPINCDNWQNFPIFLRHSSHLYGFFRAIFFSKQMPNIPILSFFPQKICLSHFFPAHHSLIRVTRHLPQDKCSKMTQISHTYLFFPNFLNKFTKW